MAYFDAKPLEVPQTELRIRMWEVQEEQQEMERLAQESEDIRQHIALASEQLGIKEDLTPDGLLSHVSPPSPLPSQDPPNSYTVCICIVEPYTIHLHATALPCLKVSAASSQFLKSCVPPRFQTAQSTGGK